MSKIVKTNITLMLANDITIEKLDELIEGFDEREIIYPENYDINLENIPCIIYRRQGNYKKPDWAEKLKKTVGIDISDKLHNTLWY